MIYCISTFSNKKWGRTSVDEMFSFQVPSKYHLTEEISWQQETFDEIFEQALALAVKLEEKRAKVKRLKREKRRRGPGEQRLQDELQKDVIQ